MEVIIYDYLYSSNQAVHLFVHTLYIDTGSTSPLNRGGLFTTPTKSK